ncbi:MAG: DUF2344 domain-containing protein [Ruminococcus sp.]|nr:DUF2344 domain-containing protein [Ruminococcus sp.]
MKSVRIWFTKEHECKYISHLDLNRCMLRAVRRAELPIWYTEGFNPHPFVTFPLPISLGICAKRECMDIRITDESYDISQIPERMNRYLPRGIQVFDATYPELDPKFICYAKYSASINADGVEESDLRTQILKLCDLDSVIIQKKSKAGMKDVDVLPYIKVMEFASDDSCSFTVILPAGNTKNIALPLIFKAMENHLNLELNYNIVKLDMYTEEMKPFA